MGRDEDATRGLNKVNLREVMQLSGGIGVRMGTTKIYRGLKIIKVERNESHSLSTMSTKCQQPNEKMSQIHAAFSRTNAIPSFVFPTKN